eukprot:Amastigsp_a677431_69.p1 type:complete len:152 gc:universal Amastigsp_a677431_69:1-456(+)
MGAHLFRVLAPNMAARVRGLGVDIVSVARIRGLLERHRERSIERLLACAERQQLDSLCGGSALRCHVLPVRAIQFFAGRWALKEALYKACGGGSQFVWRDVAIVNGADGAPQLDLAASERVRAALSRRGAEHAVLSVSHESEFAFATVIIQ